MARPGSDMYRSVKSPGGMAVRRLDEEVGGLQLAFGSNMSFDLKIHLQYK